MATNPPHPLARLYGENIRKFRREKDLTQDQLAQAIGTRQALVSRWEMGVYFPPDPLKIKIAAALKQDPRQMFPLIGTI